MTRLSVSHPTLGLEKNYSPSLTKMHTDIRLNRGLEFFLNFFLFYEVVDFNVHINEAGEEYNEKIEVNPENQTELFEVPAHPGVDRSDVLHDFKAVRFAKQFIVASWFSLH